MLGVYNQATLAISTTVEDLLHGVGASSNLLYDIRRHAAEKARTGFELAELAYEAHVHQHHCEAPVKYADPVRTPSESPWVKQKVVKQKVDKQK